MARVCAFCEKKPVVGNKISHSNIKTKVRHLPNLQKMRVLLDGLVQRVYVCTRCLRSGFASKPYNAPRPQATAPVAEAAV